MRVDDAEGYENLSIPFVGFLRMQQPGDLMASVQLICTLNSLCGISSNATMSWRRLEWPYPFYTLNSLCGISSNATKRYLPWLYDVFKDNSQFPLWDFFECNALDIQWKCRDWDELAGVSQFPLWDFFECNQILGIKSELKRLPALNSLCGISSNATRVT